MPVKHDQLHHHALHTDAVKNGIEDSQWTVISTFRARRIQPLTDKFPWQPLTSRSAIDAQRPCHLQVIITAHHAHCGTPTRPLLDTLPPLAHTPRRRMKWHLLTTSSVLYCDAFVSWLFRRRSSRFCWFYDRCKAFARDTFTSVVPLQCSRIQRSLSAPSALDPFATFAHSALSAVCSPPLLLLWRHCCFDVIATTAAASECDCVIDVQWQLACQ